MKIFSYLNNDWCTILQTGADMLNLYLRPILQLRKKSSRKAKRLIRSGVYLQLHNMNEHFILLWEYVSTRHIILTQVNQWFLQLPREEKKKTLTKNNSAWGLDSMSIFEFDISDSVRCPFVSNSEIDMSISFCSCVLFRLYVGVNNHLSAFNLLHTNPP